MKNIIMIKINNIEKYARVKRGNVELSTDIFQNSDIFFLSSDEKWLWLFILIECAKKEGEMITNIDALRRFSGISKRKTARSLNTLVVDKLIEVCYGEN